MNTKLLTLSSRLLDEHKAQDITVLDVRERTTLADYMVIASGASRRRVSALAERLLEGVREQGFEPLGVEGAIGADADWILIDLGDVIVHIMYPETRDYYQLETLWGADREQGAAGDG